MKKLLTVAGSDPSGGAGIQADIKTITVHKMYAMSVITALTAQNTTGVYGVHDVPPDFVAKQMDCIFTDIFPDAVKIGMVSNAGIIEAMSEKLIEYKAKKIVLDPVMISTSGSRLLSDDCIDMLVKRLLPIADCVTPNIPEAEVISGININSTDDMLNAAKRISQMFQGSVIIKGGHMANSADDLVLHNGKAVWLKADRIDNPNNHGTGCTLSSAIACNLANGNNIVESVRYAKDYVTRALRANLNFGRGSGPLNHCFE